MDWLLGRWWFRGAMCICWTIAACSVFAPNDLLWLIAKGAAFLAAFMYACQEAVEAADALLDEHQ